MASLRTRHVGVSQRLSDSFGLPLEDCSGLIRSHLEAWNDFFGARGPSHILVYYQPKQSHSEVCSCCATCEALLRQVSSVSMCCTRKRSHASLCLRLSSLQGNYVSSSSGTPRLYQSYGNQEALVGKAVYFVRTTEKPIDVDKVRCATERILASRVSS